MTNREQSIVSNNRAFACSMQTHQDVLRKKCCKDVSAEFCPSFKCQLYSPISVWWCNCSLCDRYMIAQWRPWMALKLHFIGWCRLVIGN